VQRVPGGLRGSRRFGLLLVGPRRAPPPCLATPTRWNRSSNSRWPHAAFSCTRWTASRRITAHGTYSATTLVYAHLHAGGLLAGVVGGVGPGGLLAARAGAAGCAGAAWCALFSPEADRVRHSPWVDHSSRVQPWIRAAGMRMMAIGRVATYTGARVQPWIRTADMRMMAIGRVAPATYPGSRHRPSGCARRCPHHQQPRTPLSRRSTDTSAGMKTAIINRPHGPRRSQTTRATPPVSLDAYLARERVTAT